MTSMGIMMDSYGLIWTVCTLCHMIYRNLLESCLVLSDKMCLPSSHRFSCLGAICRVWSAGFVPYCWIGSEDFRSMEHMEQWNGSSLGFVEKVETECE